MSDFGDAPTHAVHLLQLLGKLLIGHQKLGIGAANLRATHFPRLADPDAVEFFPRLPTGSTHNGLACATVSDRRSRIPGNFGYQAVNERCRAGCDRWYRILDTVGKNRGNPTTFWFRWVK